MNFKTHWSTIYSTKAANDVSWYQERPDMSLAFIQNTNLGTDAHIIDVGAGASTLADNLLKDGYRNITLLDIAEEALNVTRSRLTDPDALQWIVGDVTEVALPQQHFDIWHDRAVFHFLTDPERYVEQVKHAVKPGGHIIIAAFALDGPTQCSGLDIVQYDAAKLQNALGTDFELVASQYETHITPWQSEQKFIYCHHKNR